MPTIDALFRALIKNGMDDLLLQPGRLPALRRDSLEHEVTKTVLDDAKLKALLGEIAPTGDVEAAAEWEFQYVLDGRPFEIRSTLAPTGWRVVVTTGDATAVADPIPLSNAEAERAATAASAGASVGEAPSGGRITSIPPLLEKMLAAEASDLHLSSKQLPRMRTHGDLTPIPGYGVATSEELASALYEITPKRNHAEFEEKNDTDFAYALPGKARFRVNVFRDQHGIGAVLRQIPEIVPTFEQLGLPDHLKKLAYLSKGLVLVTGPTGSGKSTSLAAIIDLINEARADHIITIEDPVEFVHPSKKCLVNQREVGVHTLSFKNALRAALREDPDIVLVGELRDLETIAMAIETAETGHLVFGTLHTSTAASTIERVVDQFPGDRQSQIRVMLSESLRAVIAQTLLKKIGGGRIAAFEILLSNPAVSNLIREGKTFQLASAMQTGRKQGMVMLNDSLVNLVKDKLVEPTEAYIKAVDKVNFLKALQAAGVRFNLDEELEA